MIRGESMGKEEVQETDDNNHEEHHTKYNGLWGETLLQLKNRLVYSRRSKNMICIYCGENAQTREHCPPRSFFPEHEIICESYQLANNAIKDFHMMKKL